LAEPKTAVLSEEELKLKLEFFTTSKTDRHLLRQKVRQKISVIKTNTFDDIKKNSSFWHFNSRFVLKTAKTQVFVMITEII
jgi:hypothetical protein